MTIHHSVLNSEILSRLVVADTYRYSGDRSEDFRSNALRKTAANLVVMVHGFRALSELSSIVVVFAFVATHNHFVSDRGGKVFNRSAPVIKLPREASEDDHLGLLGLLNSSIGLLLDEANHAQQRQDPVVRAFEGMRKCATILSSSLEHD